MVTVSAPDGNGTVISSSRRLPSSPRPSGESMLM